MKRKRFTEARMIEVLNQAEAGAPTKLDGQDRPKFILPCNTYSLSRLVAQMENFGQLAARDIQL